MISTLYSGLPSSQSSSKSTILPFATPNAICLALASPIRLGWVTGAGVGSGCGFGSGSGSGSASASGILSISDPSIIFSKSIPLSLDSSINSINVKFTKSSVLRSGFSIIIFLMKVIFPTDIPYLFAKSSTVLLFSRACVSIIGLKLTSSSLLWITWFKSFACALPLSLSLLNTDNNITSSSFLIYDSFNKDSSISSVMSSISLRL